MDLCTGWDGPQPVWSVVFTFAVIILLSGFMGWLRHSRWPAVRPAATLALGIVILFSIWSSLITSRNGLISDLATCQPLGSSVELTILTVLNLAVLGAPLVAGRRRRPLLP